MLTSIVASVAQAAGGLVTREVLSLFASGLSALVMVVFAGSYLFGRVDSGAYRKALNVLLILLGVLMLGKALSGF